MYRLTMLALALALAPALPLEGQTPASTAAPAQPSWRTPPAYPVQYEPATPDTIKEVLDRVLDYLEQATAVTVVDRTTGTKAELANLPADAALERVDFLITSYEWGVTYAGMLLAEEVTSDRRYGTYVDTRMAAIAALAARRQSWVEHGGEASGLPRGLSLIHVVQPRSLDDSGSMCAAMIKTVRAGRDPEVLRPWIDNYMHWIRRGQFRFDDGTLARHRPLANALWLDDLYMSVPALAQMAAWTGDTACYNDAARQVLQFAQRMFVPERGLFMHGWIQDMETHPQFFWARANGWAAMAMAELLSVLPDNHPARPAVLELYRAHARGLAALQGNEGLWHQLLDRSDTYLETSASAMFVYAIARGVNRRWLDPLAYGPMLSTGWNAVGAKVNAQGQVEGTCIGTGMGFDPMFYAFRPVSVFAAHGYGPVLLAGAEMIALCRDPTIEARITDGAVQMLDSPSQH